MKPGKRYKNSVNEPSVFIVCFFNWPKNYFAPRGVDNTASLIKMKTQNKPQFTFLVSTILQKKEASWFQYSSMQWCRSFFWANSKSQLSESKLKIIIKLLIFMNVNPCEVLQFRHVENTVRLLWQYGPRETSQ